MSAKRDIRAGLCELVELGGTEELTRLLVLFCSVRDALRQGDQGQALELIGDYGGKVLLSMALPDWDFSEVNR
jgi:hypothetical protein